MRGRIFTIVGPSGVGKDSLMAEVSGRLPALHMVRRVITRPEEAGGEPFEGVSEAEFQRRAARGDFALQWEAHGLSYGVPRSVCDVIGAGRDAVFNGSRAVLDQARTAFPDLVVLHITARREVLAARLLARGRETPAQIEQRLDRKVQPMPEGLEVVEIDNSGDLQEAADRLVAWLQPVRA
jgi:ribose 1,5-bisphosphokinase